MCGCDGIEEVAVMADDDEGAFVGVEELFEPADRIEVEVVGRFVEKERFGIAEESLAEHDPELHVGRDRAEGLVMHSGRNAHAEEERFRIGFCAIAIFFGDDFFELAEANADLIGHLLLIEIFAFCKCIPEPLIAHDDDIEDFIVAEVLRCSV